MCDLKNVVIHVFLISNQTFKELSMEKKNEYRKTTSKTEIQIFYLESGKWAKPTQKMNKQNLNNFALKQDKIQWRAKSYWLGAY